MMFLNGENICEDLVERETVSNVEIWVECLGKKVSDMERKDSDALTALMMKVEGWEKSGKRVRLPLYGQQRLYERVKHDLDEF